MKKRLFVFGVLIFAVCLLFSSCGRPSSKTGHTHVFITDASAFVSPTCTTDGQLAFVCKECGQTKTERIDATGHDYNGVVTEPTYTREGYTTYTCSRCGDSYIADRVPKLEQTEIMVPVVEGQYIPATSISDYVKMTFSFTDANGEARTGDIVILLRPDCAPLTVANFKKLIFSGYYNGTEIFRVVNNRFIQGGEREDEEADYIKGEFEANGVENPLSHVRGTISMSRHTSLYNGIPAYDTASSCFFIMQKDYTDWDGKYAAFGTVVFGIEIIDLIADQELVYSERYEDVVYPKNPVLISSVSFVKPVN